MEIQLIWNAEDQYIDNINRSLLSSFTENNSIMSQLQYNTDYIIPSITTTQITKDTIIKDIITSKSSQPDLHIYPTTNTISQIKNLLILDGNKEVKYSQLKETFNDLKKNCILNPQIIKRKIFSLVHQRSNYYFKLLESILEKLISYDKVRKELREIEGNMIKFKASQLINLYFKLYYERCSDCVKYMMKHGDFFVANQENLHNIIAIYQELVKSVVKQVNIELKNMLKENYQQLYTDHSGEYEEIFEYIERVVELYPVLKHTDMKCPRVVFSAFDSPAILQLSENQFIIVNHILTQLPTYDALKVTFNNFKQNDLNTKAIEMAFKRDCNINKRFGTVSLHYIYSSLLYEE